MDRQVGVCVLLLYDVCWVDGVLLFAFPLKHTHTHHPPPLAGIAHLLEHMAFKGTQRIGTKDFAAEAALLDALDGAFYALRDAQVKGAPMTEVVRMAREFQQLQVSGVWGGGYGYTQ